MGKVLNRKFVSQKSIEMLTETVKSLVPWQYLSLDFLETFLVKGNVNKLKKRKIYGLTFNYLRSLAVCMDIVTDYSTERFLVTLRQVFY